MLVAKKLPFHNIKYAFYISIQERTSNLHSMVSTQTSSSALFFFRLLLFFFPSTIPPSVSSTLLFFCLIGSVCSSPPSSVSNPPLGPSASPNVSCLHCLRRAFLLRCFLSFFFLSGSRKDASFFSPANSLSCLSSASRMSRAVRPKEVGEVSR